MNIAILVFLMGQNPECPRTKEISEYMRLYDVSGTHNVGPTTQYRFNVELASQPIAGSMMVNRI